MNNAFGDYLRTERVNNGIRLSELAKKLNITHVHLSKVERGMSNPLARSYWDILLREIPTLKADKLDEYCRISKAHPMELADAPEQYQQLGVLFARRLEKKNLSPDAIDKLRAMLAE